MELEVDKKEFERIQQELIQATVENITLEYFEYEGKKWLNEDFVIPISVIQKKKEQLEERIKNPEKTSYWASYTISECIGILRILEEILKEGRK